MRSRVADAMTARALALALAPGFEVSAAAATLAHAGGRPAREQALRRLRGFLETGDDVVTRKAERALTEAVRLDG
jgi:hypothetical protein